MQTLTAFLNFLSSLAWPGVVLYLLGWRFRDAIVSIIGRVRKIGPTGAEIADQQGENPRMPELPAPPQPAPATFTPLYEGLIASARERLDQMAGANPAARESAALWLYARAWIMRAHERNYRSIFGSQIRGLRYLNEHREGVSSLRTFYQPAFDGKGYDYAYEQWEFFLTNTSGLAERRDGNLFITEAGRLFLQHIVEHGYSEDQPL